MSEMIKTSEVGKSSTLLGVSANALVSFCIEREITHSDGTDYRDFITSTEKMSPQQRNVLNAALELVNNSGEEAYRKQICQITMILSGLQRHVESQKHFEYELSTLVGTAEPTLFDRDAYLAVHN